MLILLCDLGEEQERKASSDELVYQEVDKGSVVLAGFMSACHELESSEGRGPRLRKMPPEDSAVDHFLNLQLMWEGPTHWGWWWGWRF